MAEENTFKVYDELEVRQKPELSSFLGNEEQVLFSGSVMKINKYRSSQERILLITDKFLYNISLGSNIMKWISSKPVVKRKIDIKRISEITLSVHPKSDQFIIHVQDDYDYRYDAVGKRSKIIQAICNTQFNMGRKLFIFYLLEVDDLAAFQTTDDDFKVNVIKKPNTGKVLATKELFEKGVEHIIANKDSLIMESMASHHLIKAKSDMGWGHEDTLGMADSPYSKVRSFDVSKPINSLEDITLTSSGYVPQSAIAVQSTDLTAKV